MNELMLRRRAMMAAAKAAPLSDPELIYTPDKILTTQSATAGIDCIGAGISDYLPLKLNDVIKYKNPTVSQSMQTSPGRLGAVIVYTASKSSCDWWNCKADGTEGSFTATRFTGNGYYRINIIMDGIADSYAYNATTGKVYYAGKNTPYYRKANIND